MIRRIASERELDYVDLFDGLKKYKVNAANPEGWKDHLIDGLHLSPSGNEFVFQELQKVITLANPTLTGGDSSTIPMYYPHWSEAKEVLEVTDSSSKNT